MKLIPAIRLKLFQSSKLALDLIHKYWHAKNKSATGILNLSKFEIMK